MSVLQNAQNLVIFGGQFTSVNEGLGSSRDRPGIDGMQLLLANVVPSAFHNSQDRFDPPKCHPETRVAILGRIIDWLEAPSSATPFMWLYGPAGAGKSAIAQTTAEKCQNVAILGATYFFSRTSVERSEIKGLIPTISYQLTETIPAVRPLIRRAVEEHPLIFQRSLDEQLKVLIINPLRALEPALSRRMLLVIDGLDECDGSAAQAAALQSLTALFRREALPLFVLCASRPEPAIRDAFNSEPLSPRSQTIPIGNSSDSRADIRIFLRNGFEQLKRTHILRRHIPTDWPSDDVVEWLVTKSCGQFSYASTVMKYVQSPNNRPMDRLKVILGINTVRNELPFAALDALYFHVLSAVDRIDAVLDIIRVIIFSKHPLLTPSFIEDFLLYEAGDVTLLLSGLHSLLHIPNPEDLGVYIGILHASLTDFFMDRSRSGRYFLHEPTSHAFLARACLRQISSYSVPDGANPVNQAWIQSVYHPFSYAHEYIVYHLERALPTDELKDALLQLDLSETIERAHRLRRSLATRWQESIFSILSWSSRLDTEAMETDDGQEAPPPNNLFLSIQTKYDEWLKSRLDRLPYCDCLMQLLALVVCEAGPGSCQCICDDGEPDSIELDFLDWVDKSTNILDYFGSFLQDEGRAEGYFVTEDYIEEVVYQYVNDHLEEIETTGSPFVYEETRKRRFGHPSVTVASRILTRAPKCREIFRRIEVATATTPFLVTLYLWTIRTSAESYIQQSR